ncbi:MAG TPA: DUF4382 domain-containing protein [Steroidobacteraceae bacterium]|nr:DUF4382 domain-containing protein [Steroidobacteraceae bacterium]
MDTRKLNFAVCGAIVATLTACGGGSSGSSESNIGSGGTGSQTATTATLPMLISDASSNDWATIGVKVLSIALIPQAGGSNVSVYTAPTPAPFVNLEQLDQLAEILGNATVPVGTYTGAVITVSGNPGDVLLTASADPEAGFALAASAAVSSSNIHVMNTQGSGTNLTAPITVNFVAPLVVSATGSTALDLEFDLSHPAFIIAHNPPSATSTQWAINFNGPVRHRPLADLRRLVLRHTYGTVTMISSDGTAITIDKDFPTLPAVSPETQTTGTQTLTVAADATNGTLFYDVDAKTVTNIKNFASETSLNGKFVRIAARYQVDGTLVATRIWASSTFNSVWVSPEGHVLNANANTDVLTITNESGVGVPLTVNANTQFFFRQPWSAVADATPIATGTAFLTDKNIVRGFKVHASVVDPLAVPLVAQTIDIETADYSGAISAPSASGFTYTHDFVRTIDDYNVTLSFIASATANGNDPMSGNAIAGYKWWNFAYPTLVDSGATAVSDFVAATGGTASFGGTAGPIIPWGVSYVIWADPADATGWSAASSILEPTPLPVGTVASPPVAATNAEAFTITAAGGATPVTVNAGTVSGSATLVYQVDMTGGIVTVSPIDITTASGLSSFTSGLAVGTKVRVSGVPQADGSVKAYVITYFTGTTPAAAS